MELKNILIVSRSFYPMNSPRSFRTTELVKEFARQGHQVTLLTIKNDAVHIPFEKEFGVTIKDLGALRFSKITLNGENGLTGQIKRGLRRGLNLFFEYPDIELMFKVEKAVEKMSGFDLLISIAVPHPVHWGVSRTWNDKQRIAKTWVADCGDPYMGHTLDSFNKMPYFKYFEKSFCRKADYITVPIEDARQGYYAEFREKINVIPQGFSFDEVKINHSSYTQNPVPTFAYAGGLIPGGRDPREFLDYLITLSRDYKFILFTKNRNIIEPYVEPANGKIEIRDFIPRKELLKVLSGMDFLINFENNTSRQQPSKLIDYYLSGRPVLSVGSSHINKEAIDEFLIGNYCKQLHQENMDKHKIENICNQFLDLSNKKQVR